MSRTATERRFKMFGMQLRKLMTVGLLAVVGILSAGCANKQAFASLQGATGQGGGACDAFERPSYQIRGATPYDQDWADRITEAGVAGCDWQRPSLRPSLLDLPPIPPALKPAPV